MSKILRKTYSVCPVCLKRIPAVHVQKGREIYMEKTCPAHGEFSTILWRGFLPIETWRGDLSEIQDGENENCPHGCGLCNEHLRDTCCILLEVTKQCNLSCAFCFAEGGMGNDIPFEKIVRDLKALAVPGQTLVQLSGGEPTIRDDLPKIVAEAKNAGCAYVQLNSNGLRLAEDEPYVRALAESGLSFVFMQFDGTDDKVYRSLRGRDLFAIKEKAIDNCSKYNLGVTLVPTLVPGVNISEIGPIIRYGISKSPAVRGIHFQPVSYFGRTPVIPADKDRFTLDDLINEINIQAGDLIPDGSLFPSACDHPLCGFHGDYIVMGDNSADGRSLYPLKKSGGEGCCCGELSKKETTAEQNRLFVARRWERPAIDADVSGGSPEDEGESGEIETLEGFLRRVKSHSFTVTAMAFQDAGNIDLERLRRCSLHVYNEGRTVPFCANYLSPLTFG